MKFYMWERAVQSAGHKLIWVLCDDGGGLPKEDEQVQCATVDRIPFKMKKKDIEKRYKKCEPARVEGSSPQNEEAAR